jgi:hypothetical protein
MALALMTRFPCETIASRMQIPGSSGAAKVTISPFSAESW